MYRKCFVFPENRFKECHEAYREDMEQCFRGRHGFPLITNVSGHCRNDACSLAKRMPSRDFDKMKGLKKKLKPSSYYIELNF